MNLQQGAYGQPAELRSLIRFWTIMETLHYPTAESIKESLQEELEAQTAAGQQAVQTGLWTQDGGTGQTAQAFGQTTAF